MLTVDDDAVDGASEQQNKEQPGTMDDGLNIVKDGWFTELSSMWPGQGLSLEVKEVLFRRRSKFQVSSTYVRQCNLAC